MRLFVDLDKSDVGTGVVRVSAIKVRGLRSTTLFGKANPYVKVNTITLYIYDDCFQLLLLDPSELLSHQDETQVEHK